eukprot:GHRR01017997.1.p1 GENE.GHRR01017997.1~~GHRR01017997.1.p1  ORF type:complete len:104 (+),score=12.00 GHRR01017997.1:507-818(+)
MVLFNKHAGNTATNFLQYIACSQFLLNVVLLSNAVLQRSTLYAMGHCQTACYGVIYQATLHIALYACTFCTVVAASKPLTSCHLLPSVLRSLRVPTKPHQASN